MSGDKAGAQTEAPSERGPGRQCLFFDSDGVVWSGPDSLGQWNVKHIPDRLNAHGAMNKEDIDYMLLRLRRQRCEGVAVRR